MTPSLRLTKYDVEKYSMTLQNDCQTMGNSSGYKLDRFNRQNKNGWNCLFIRAGSLLKKYRICVHDGRQMLQIPEETSQSLATKIKEKRTFLFS